MLECVLLVCKRVWECFPVSFWSHLPYIIDYQNLHILEGGGARPPYLLQPWVPGSSDWLLRRFPSLRWTRKRPEMSFFERIVPVGNVLWNGYTRETIGATHSLPEYVIEGEFLALGLVAPDTLYQMKSNNVTTARSVHCSFIQRGCRGCFPSWIRGRCPKTMSPSPSVGTCHCLSMFIYDG